MWQSIFVITIVVLAGLANLFLAIYVYAKNPKEKVNKTFFYFGLVLFLWCFTDLMSLLVKDLFWLRATYSVGTFVPMTGIFFSHALANKKVGKWIKIFVPIPSLIIFIVGLFTPFLVKNLISFSDFGYNVDFGPFFVTWGVCTIFLILIALFLPFSVLNKVSGQRRKQIIYFLTGAILFALWAIIVSIILPFFGFADLSNVDSPATIFLVGFTSYAIIKFNLMDISSLFFQAFIYSLVIVAIIAILLILMFVGSFFLEQSLIWPIYVIVAIVAAALFYIGRLFFIEKRDLEAGRAELTDLLKKSEENRIRAEMERDKTSTIISSFSDGLIILDEKDEIFSVNPEAEKILEIEAGKLLNKSVLFLAGFPKASLLAAILKPGLKSIFKKQVELAKDYIIEVSVIPLVSLNFGEDHSGHLIVLHDISREKIVDKMKTEFVSLAAHQLRTPLSIIKWSMSMLKNEDFGKLTKKQAEIIKNTFRNNERLISLVNDLLDVTRIEEGRYLYKVAMADIKEIVTAVIDSDKEEIKKRKIKIDFQSQVNLPQTMMDEARIKLVVQNFIDNAIKYSYIGGQIVVSLRSDDQNIEFSVRDYGIGIPKNQQDKIFTKFFRGDNASKVNAQGSGLGLFLVKNIVEAHGGKIWFESEDDPKNGLTGTNFHFNLPIKKAGV